MTNPPYECHEGILSLRISDQLGRIGIKSPIRLANRERREISTEIRCNATNQRKRSGTVRTGVPFSRSVQCVCNWVSSDPDAVRPPSNCRRPKRPADEYDGSSSGPIHPRAPLCENHFPRTQKYTPAHRHRRWCFLSACRHPWRTAQFRNGWFRQQRFRTHVIIEDDHRCTASPNWSFTQVSAGEAWRASACPALLTVVLESIQPNLPSIHHRQAFRVRVPRHRKFQFRTVKAY